MKEKAIAAYGVLDYIGRDLVVASEAFRHFQSPEIRTSLSQHSPAYLNRLCLNHIFIALSRWQEFYKKFAHDIPDPERSSAKKLNADLDRRDLRTFRNEFLAHIWCKRHNRPLTDSEISDTAHKVADGDFSRFVNWIHDYHAPEEVETVVRIIERLRDSFFDVYNLTGQEISPEIFEVDA